MLYPLPLSLADKANDAHNKAMEQELSERLIELSNHSALAAAPTLLVVGTPHRQQHEWLSNEQEQQQKQQQQQRNSGDANSNKDLWTVLTTVTVADVARFCWWATTSSIRWSVHFILSGSVTIRDSLFGHWMGGGGGHPRSD